MTIALSYLGDLSRVRIALSDLPDGTYTVERSANQLLWSTVRGGAGVIVSDGTANVDDYEFVPNVENFYRVTSLAPPPGLILSGASGDHASTPDTAELDITGDLIVQAAFTPEQWATGTIQYVAAKWDFDVDERSYTLRLAASSRLVALAWSEDGINVLSSNVDLGVDDGERVAVMAWLDTDFNGTNHRVLFYISESGSIEGPWSLIQAETFSGTTSIHSSTSDLDVGGAISGTSGMFTGRVHQVAVWDGEVSSSNAPVGTTAAAPDFAAQPTGAIAFDDDAGRSWTLNGNAAIFTSESASITPPPFGNCEIWLKSVRYPLLNQVVDIADYSPLNRAGRAGVFPIQGRSFPSGSLDIANAFRFEVTFVADTAEQGRKLDLSLAVGDIFYLQIPPDTNPRFPPKSMYVVVLDAGTARLGVGEKRHLTVQLAEMAKPAPQIVGTTLIWSTVFNLLGTWEQLLAAEPTWNDLLALVGSPNDLVVI